ncbi:MAG: gliding motility-associated C-terminal domain-containing protein [Bacteroidia bacterium]|nr:gliding motility-associated C-terminal domain-containing protein [Bacteroidia bacterium]
MKTTKKIIIVLLAFIASFANKSWGQVGLKSTYIFTADSVAGFDEAAAASAALANGCYGKEFKVFLYNQKRIYVKQKYNLKTASAKKLTLFQNPASFKTSALPPGGACNNEDFELATSQVIAPTAVQGWTFQSGSYNGGCSPPSFFGAGIYTVHASPIIDPRIPGQISSYFDAQLNTTPSGNSFLQLNDGTAGAKSAQASKAFIVTPNNAVYQYAYLPVIEDGTHACCDQPGFDIKITVTNTVTNTSTVLACPNISVAVPGPGCSFTIPPGGPNFVPCTAGYPTWVYSNWTASAIDLSPYLNNLVQLDITVVDCGFGGHGAYIYFDSKCSPMTIIGNNNPFPAGTPSITLPTCGSTGATIIAPPGLGPYSWAPANPPYNTPSMSNQTFITNNSGTYTLTMNPPGSCQPIIRLITVTITPAPQIVASVQQAPCGGTVAIASCTTAGSASVASTIVWSPNPLSVNSSSTQANYTISTGPVTVTASDPLGCMASATVNINGAPPIPTFTLTNVTGSGSITCTHPCINYIANTSYTYGTLTYTWISLSGTASGTNVSFCNPAQYTVTATDLATGCSTFSVFTIGQDIAAPAFTVTPTTQNIVCPVGSPATFTAITSNTATNMTHLWTSPLGGTSTSGGTISIYSGVVGISTVCVINNINGCSTCKTVTVTSLSGFPTYSVTSPQQFTIGCGTTSLTSINISNVNTYTNPSNPPTGGPVSYTLLAPGYTGPIPVITTGSLSPTSVYTVNTPGQYTVVVHDNTNHCETMVSVSIISNTFAPQISAVAATTTLNCYTPCTLLKGTSTNSNTSFSWAYAGPPAGQLPNDTLTVCATAAVNNTVVGTYTLSVTDNINKCKSTQALTIYQNTSKPNALITPAGSPSITCTTPTINLTNASFTNAVSAPFPHGNVVTGYLWTGPSPQANLANSSTYIAYTPGIYTLTVQDVNNGCFAVATKTIIDNRIYPIVNNPVAPAPFILDCGSTCATIAPLISGSTTGFTYSWTAVPTTSFSCYTCPSTCVNKIGEYKITVTNPVNGCSAEGRVEVINGALNGDFNASTYNGFAPLGVTFTNLSASSSTSTPTASITSAWSFGNGTNSVTANVSISPVTTFTNAGTYTVTMYVVKGTCIDTVRKVITVELPSELEVPNVFTPNGDGNNDTFFLKVQNVTDIHVYIFDRWGNQVYETTSTTGNITWDGKTASGKDIPPGTYFYTMKATGKDGTEYDKKGNISIFR